MVPKKVPDKILLAILVMVTSPSSLAPYYLLKSDVRHLAADAAPHGNYHSHDDGPIKPAAAAAAEDDDAPNNGLPKERDGGGSLPLLSNEEFLFYQAQGSIALSKGFAGGNSDRQQPSEECKWKRRWLG